MHKDRFVIRNFNREAARDAPFRNCGARVAAGARFRDIASPRLEFNLRSMCPTDISPLDYREVNPTDLMKPNRHCRRYVRDDLRLIMFFAVYW